MSETPNVLHFRGCPEESGYDGHRCHVCESAWFIGRVVIGPSDSITGYTSPLLCAGCGAEHRPEETR